MTAEVENLILEHLRRMRGVMDAMREDIGDLRLRMTAVEGHVGQIEVKLGHMQLEIAGLNHHMDRYDERLSRIERRLDLVDA